MESQTKELDELVKEGYVSLNIGFPAIRVKPVEEKAKESGELDTVDIRAIVAKSVKKNYIDESSLEAFTVTKEFCDDSKKKEFFTRLDDIVVKLTTPYECTIIHKPEDEGLLITSSCLFIRISEEGKNVIDPYFLACYLTTKDGIAELRGVASRNQDAQRQRRLGVINKGQLYSLTIPWTSIEKQRSCGDIFKRVLNSIEFSLNQVSMLSLLQEKAFGTVVTQKDGE
jgi:hypothetical protein